MSDLTSLLLEIKEDIEKKQSRLERCKGEQEAVLKQLKELGLSEEKAISEQKKLQKDLDKIETILEKKIENYMNKYPMFKMTAEA